MKNLKFRKINENDIDDINFIRNDSSEWLHNHRGFTRSETAHWFRTTDPDWYIIHFEDETEVIGYFRLTKHSEINKNLYIGADIHPKWRGQGIGYRAYVQFMEWLFNERKLHKISLEVISSNQRAYHLYKKLGFVEEGRQRDEIWRNGKWLDSIMMSIKAEEFFNNKENNLYG